jgi:hypothetical protein
MNWEAIGAIGEILGALGVIFSVLYLAYQVRGDRKAVLANTRQMRQNGVRELTLAVAESEYLIPAIVKTSEAAPATKLLMNEYDLTREEAQRLGSLSLANLRQMETNLKMEMNDDEYDQTINTIRNALSGYSGIWWQEGKAMFSREFVKKADGLIAAGL